MPAAGSSDLPDFSGYLHCLDAKTGRQYWAHNLDAQVWGSPLVADGKVYVVDGNGMVSIFEVGKEKKLTGEICCAKCELGLEAKCATAIKVKEDGKDVVYYFDPQTHKKEHSKYCTSSKEGTVTGTVEEKDGKKVVKVTKIEVKK